jgi:hypothetical protein
MEYFINFNENVHKYGNDINFEKYLNKCSAFFMRMMKKYDISITPYNYDLDYKINENVIRDTTGFKYYTSVSNIDDMLIDDTFIDDILKQMGYMDD